MKDRLRVSISAALAIAVGLVVLAGYFVSAGPLANLRDIFLRWTVILAAVALIVGVINLLSVHWQKATTGAKGGAYSMVLIAALILTVVVGGLFGPTGTWPMWIFNNIQVPAEASLMALLAIVLAYATARMLSRRLTVFSVIFIATLLVILLGTATLPVLELSGLSELRAWITRLPAAAGARGILLGVVLGTVATGLRVLIGAERPYEG